MTAFFIATVSVNDPEKFAEYGKQAGASIKAHGGKLLLKGKVAEVLAGEASHKTTVVVEFPDQKTLQAWYHSDTYQAVIPLRDEAADVTIVSYDVPPS